MTYWEPATKDMRFYKSFEEVPEIYRSSIRACLFPPTPEDAAKYNLTRCIRVLPHQQNTGGFFIALIEKKKKLPWELDDQSVVTESNTTEGASVEVASEAKNEGEQRKKQKYYRGFKEDPFVFFDGTEEIYESIKKFYQLSDDFNPINLLTRCREGKKKNIYFSADILRNVVSNNEDRIKFINLGVKAFARCDNRNRLCDFRMAQEGLPSVIGYVGTSRRLSIGRDDLVKLLSNSDPTKPPELAGLTDTIQKDAESLEPGSCVLQYKTDELELNVVGWRGAKSLRAYVDQHDTVHMLRLLGADVSKYEKNKFEEKKEANDATDPTD